MKGSADVRNPNLLDSTESTSNESTNSTTEKTEPAIAAQQQHVSNTPAGSSNSSGINSSNPSPIRTVSQDSQRQAIGSSHTVPKRKIFSSFDKQSQVSFSDNVKVKFIPFYFEYGPDLMNCVWYTKEDYRQFHEVAIKFVQMYGSLKHIEDDDKLHDEPALIIRHKESTKHVPLVQKQLNNDDLLVMLDNQDNIEMKRSASNC
jgi:hypothetical protein